MRCAASQDSSGHMPMICAARGSLISSAACLPQTFPRCSLSLCREILDLRSLGLAALAVGVRVLGPGPAVAAPTLARVRLFGHVVLLLNWL